MPRIAWVTNVGAPYRHPVWTALARRASLTVGLLADNEPNRRWNAELPVGVRRLRTRAFAIHRGDVHLYLLARPALSRSLDAVILPGWEMPAAWQLLAEAKLRRIRTIAFYESTVGSHRFSAGPVAALRRRFFRSVDAVVTVGEASREAVLGFGVSPDRIVSTHNAVDVAAIHEAARRDGDDRADTFLYVGQLIHRKNVDGLLDAFAGLPTQARLIVAGEGPEDTALAAQAAALGVADRVDFRGYVPYDKVPLLMSEAATLVLPSRTEVYGLVVTEALAAGLQVVVTDACGVYADVADLPGVYGATLTLLGNAMQRSAAAWAGPLEQPTLLAWTPDAMAADVLRATAVARSNR